MIDNVSIYVPMPDGTRIALDAWLPSGAGRRAPVPTVVEFTRYWRATEGEEPPPRIGAFTDHGFAYAIVDVRGSGASFGVRRAELSTAETRDFSHVIEWVAGQAWSNGAVATTGVSYAGNTAENAMIGAPAALKATIPRFTDFDWYASLLFPGGLLHRGFLHPWSLKVQALDLNDGPRLAELDGAHEGKPVRSVKPVGTDENRDLLARAVADHRQNASPEGGLQGMTFRDDAKLANSLQDPDDRLVTPYPFQSDQRLREIPSYHWASFADAGTAEGAIARFLGSPAPMKVIIGYWTHGAYGNANPFTPHEKDVTPSEQEQYRMMAEFLAPLKGPTDAGDDSARAPAIPESERAIHYFTAGQDEWKATSTWPPPGTTSQRYYFDADSSLATVVPSGGGVDGYTVNFEVGTGCLTRWSTQRGGTDVDYGDRVKVDRRLLTYTSEPLAASMEITGTPLVHLVMSSTEGDGAVIAYLESVAPDGRVTMLTEGQLRLIHWRVSDKAPPYPVAGPYRTFERADGQPMVPNQFEDIAFAMLPLSVEVPKGHRLRVAIAGNDADNFDRVPIDAVPQYSFRRGVDGSYVDLPVVDDAAGRHT